MADPRVARSELILGSEESAKSARAEALVAAWLAASASHRAVSDVDPVAIAKAIGGHGDPRALIVADCLTLWLTAAMLKGIEPDRAGPRPDLLVAAIAACAGPLVLLSNEVGSEALPAARDTRAFVASLDTLNQAAVAACERVTLMSGGTPLLLKGEP